MREQALGHHGFPEPLERVPARAPAFSPFSPVDLGPWEAVNRLLKPGIGEIGSRTFIPGYPRRGPPTASRRRDPASRGPGCRVPASRLPGEIPWVPGTGWVRRGEEADLSWTRFYREIRRGGQALPGHPAGVKGGTSRPEGTGGPPFLVRPGAILHVSTVRRPLARPGPGSCARSRSSPGPSAGPRRHSDWPPGNPGRERRRVH